jgi:hypothetical protein
MTPTTVLVTITTAGTPQQITTDATLRAKKVRIQPLDGIGYVGIEGLNKTTFAGCLARLPQDSPLVIEADDNCAQIQLSKYWLDSTANTQKFLVAYWA